MMLNTPRTMLTQSQLAYDLNYLENRISKLVWVLKVLCEMFSRDKIQWTRKADSITVKRTKTLTKYCGCPFQITIVFKSNSK